MDGESRKRKQRDKRGDVNVESIHEKEIKDKERRFCEVDKAKEAERGMMEWASA